MWRGNGMWIVAIAPAAFRKTAIVDLFPKSDGSLMSATKATKKRKEPVMSEYGIFSDEGCLESGFFSEEEAWARATSQYGDEPNLTVEEICPDHEEQARFSCELCEEEE